MKAIIDILYLEEYKLLLLLNTGRETIVNLEKTLEAPAFESLKEKKNFSKFVMMNGAIAWSNGTDLKHEYLLNMIEEEIKVAA